MKNRKFKQGDFAYCINNKRISNQQGTLPQLDLHLPYIVLSTRVCMCGRVKLDIGLRKERESKLFCNKCGTASTGSETYWVDSSRFIHREDISEQLNQAVEQENYELAAVLRDVLI